MHQDLIRIEKKIDVLQRTFEELIAGQRISDKLDQLIAAVGTSEKLSQLIGSLKEPTDAAQAALDNQPK